MSTTIPPFPRRPAVLEPSLQSIPVMDFPLEIRNMIWDFALPRPRVFEVINSPAAHAQDRAQREADGADPAQLDGPPEPKKQLVFANVNDEPLHPLAGVSREARAYVLERFRRLKLLETTKWIDLAHDILLFEPYLLVGRLIQSLRHLDEIPDIRDNVPHVAFGVSFDRGGRDGGPPRLSHPVSSHIFSDFHMTTLLSVLSRFPKLRKIIFVVHQEFHFDCEVPPLAASDSGANNRERDPHDRTRALKLDAGAAENPSPEPLDSFYSSEPFHLHQGYSFGFDVERLLNGEGGHPQENVFFPYPLPAVEADDKGNKGKAKESALQAAWGQPWPANEVWQTFAYEFRSVMDDATEKLAVDGDSVRAPILEGTALLWRYT